MFLLRALIGHRDILPQIVSIQIEHLDAPERLARFPWLKIGNPTYSQIVGRDELFDLKVREKSVSVNTHD
jgi:hypothetical protein